MTLGDRVVVIDPEDEWFATAGVIVGMRKDGFIQINPDSHPKWVVAFWPQHLELESLLQDGGKDVPRD